MESVQVATRRVPVVRFARQRNPCCLLDSVKLTVERPPVVWPREDESVKAGNLPEVVDYGWV